KGRSHRRRKCGAGQPAGGFRHGHRSQCDAAQGHRRDRRPDQCYRPAGERSDRARRELRARHRRIQDRSGRSEEDRPDDKLTVIDLKASPPKVSAQLQAGQGAAGVSINRAGTLALVANRSEGTVSVFSIAGHALTPVGKINLGDDKSGPSHVAITPDGKTALVTRDGDNKISVLSIDGNKVEHTKRDISAGLRPYG